MEIDLNEFMDQNGNLCRKCGRPVRWVKVIATAGERTVEHHGYEVAHEDLKDQDQSPCRIIFDTPRALP